MENQQSGVRRFQQPANRERARQNLERAIKRGALLSGKAVILMIALAVSWPLTASMLQIPKAFYDFAFQEYFGFVLFLWTFPRLTMFFIGGFRL